MNDVPDPDYDIRAALTFALPVLAGGQKLANVAGPPSPGAWQAIVNERETIASDTSAASSNLATEEHYGAIAGCFNQIS